MSTIRKRIPMFLFALAMMVAMALPTFAAEPRALLDVPTKTKVHITSRNYSSAYLNVENKASIVQSGDTVGVWSNTGDDSQRWYIYLILSVVHRVWWSSNGTAACPWGNCW